MNQRTRQSESGLSNHGASRNHANSPGADDFETHSSVTHVNNVADGQVGHDVGSDHRPVRATLAFVDGTP